MSNKLSITKLWMCLCDLSLHITPQITLNLTSCETFSIQKRVYISRLIPHRSGISRLLRAAVSAAITVSIQVSISAVVWNIPSDVHLSARLLPLWASSHQTLLASFTWSSIKMRQKQLKAPNALCLNYTRTRRDNKCQDELQKHLRNKFLQ